MTDRPIIFSGPMVCALLDGRKAQTRRLATSPLRKCQPGDRLYVREAWGCHWATDNQAPRDIDSTVWSVRYDADAHIRPAASDGSLALATQFRRLRPSIHMPRWASRLTLTVTEVRVQPLQAISIDDCVQEGVGPDPDGPHTAYARLWAALHGPESYLWNPEVVALTFTVERANIDKLTA